MGCLVGFANDAPPEIAEKRNLLGILYCLFFMIYPAFCSIYLTVLAFDGFGGSDYDYLLGAHHMALIVSVNSILIMGYNLTEVILLFCCYKYNSYCTITFRTLIAINDISLFIISIIDLVNQIKERLSNKSNNDFTFAACTITIFPIMIAINCTILYTISRFERRGSPENPVTRE